MVLRFSRNERRERSDGDPMTRHRRTSPKPTGRDVLADAGRQQAQCSINQVQRLGRQILPGLVRAAVTRVSPRAWDAGPCAGRVSRTIHPPRRTMQIRQFRSPYRSPRCPGLKCICTQRRPWCWVLWSNPTNMFENVTDRANNAGRMGAEDVFRLSYARIALCPTPAR